MAVKELLVQSAVTLLATGRAKNPAAAVELAARVLADVEQALAARKARGAKGKAGGKSGVSRALAPAKPKPLPVRARRVLERIGAVGPQEDPTPQALRGRVCEAHLFSAKGCGHATIAQIAAWFSAHGEALSPGCATYEQDWLTSRCDERPGQHAR